MFDKIRILVVEDDEDIREPYKRSLERKGYYVDEASNLAEALSAINAKTYHAAVVDLMLAGRGKLNLDGLAILKELQNLNEGTKAIVLSSQTNAQISADSLQEYGALKYVSKDIIRNDLETLAEIVDQTLEKVQLITFGHEIIGSKVISKTALKFLVGKEKDDSFLVDKCLRILKPKGGYKELETFMDSFTLRLTPLMPLQNVNAFYDLEDSLGVLSASFWSKSIGKPITLVTGSHNKHKDILNGKVRDQWNEKEEIREARYENQNLCGYVFNLQGYDREAFEKKIN